MKRKKLFLRALALLLCAAAHTDCGAALFKDRPNFVTGHSLESNLVICYNSSAITA